MINNKIEDVLFFLKNSCQKVFDRYTGVLSLLNMVEKSIGKPPYSTQDALAASGPDAVDPLIIELLFDFLTPDEMKRRIAERDTQEKEDAVKYYEKQKNFLESIEGLVPGFGFFDDLVANVDEQATSALFFEDDYCEALGICEDYSEGLGLVLTDPVISKFILGNNLAFIIDQQGEKSLFYLDGEYNCGVAPITTMTDHLFVTHLPFFFQEICVF